MTVPRKCVAMPTIDILQVIVVNQRQRKREKAATFAFV